MILEFHTENWDNKFVYYFKGFFGPSKGPQKALISPLSLLESQIQRLPWCSLKHPPTLYMCQSSARVLARARGGVSNLGPYTSCNSSNSAFLLSTLVLHCGIVLMKRKHGIFFLFFFPLNFLAFIFLALRGEGGRRKEEKRRRNNIHLWLIQLPFWRVNSKKSSALTSFPALFPVLVFRKGRWT